MTSEISTSYDDVPYEGQPFPFTHPDQLATAAALLGLDAPSPDHCRVLELGCGDGGNLIPMAESLPGSRFFGVDLGAEHIKAGNTLIEKFELANIELRQMDLTRIDSNLGEFDYVICHGVYSWVPPVVQNRILEICSQQLSKNGVAFISHNTFPGWHMRRMIRDMTLFNIDRDAEPAMQLQQARTFLRAFRDGIAGQTDAYSHLLRGEVERAIDAADHYFFHEHLEQFNEPTYLHEFVDRARTHQLKYLCDAEIRLMLPDFGAPQIESLVSSLAVDAAGRQQYMDFVTNRTFRKTLLCHADVANAEQPNPSRLQSMYVSTRSVPASSNCNIRGGEPEEFSCADGTSISVNSSLVKAAFIHLSEISPQCICVEELMTAARQRLGFGEASPVEKHVDIQELGYWLLIAHVTVPTSLIDLACQPPRFVTHVSEFPKASGWARWQASRGTVVTNRRHQLLTLDELQLCLLQLMDGAHDHAALTVDVQRLADEGFLTLPENATAAVAVERCLDQCLKGMLLVG